MARQAFQCSYDPKTKLYRKQLKNSAGKYYSIYDRDKGELLKKYEAAKASIAQGFEVLRNPTVAEYAAHWYHLNTPGLSASRCADYRNAINNHICPVIGDIKIREVTPDQVKQVMVGMAKLSASAQQKVVTTLKRIFQAAEDNNLVHRSPCRSLKPGGYKSKEKEPLTDEQAAALISAVEGTAAYLFVMIGLYAGLRREEILGLKWDCVNLEGTPFIEVKRAVHFERGRPVLDETLKSKAARRTIPIPTVLADALKAEKEKSSSELVIPNATGGVRSRQSFRRLWEIVENRTAGTARRYDRKQKKSVTVEKKLGEKCPNHKHSYTLDFSCTPHLLRHTYITNLCRSGMNIKKIQYLAGHATIQMTMNIYAHVVGNQPEEMIGDINAAFQNKANNKDNTPPETPPSILPQSF